MDRTLEDEQLQNCCSELAEICKILLAYVPADGDQERDLRERAESAIADAKEILE